MRNVRVILPNFQNRLQGFKSQIKTNVRMAERFAFVTEVEINLLVDKAAPENTKNYPLHTLLTFLTVSCLLSFRLICKLTQCSNTQARCEIFAWFQPSFILFNSPWIKNVARETHAKRRKVNIIHSHSKVFRIFFHTGERRKPSTSF